MIEMISAILAIVLIDVVLGGENALVIAMASRNLPPHLRRRALVWGTFGAVAVRFICVAALTYLLMVPGLRLVGGLALIYIAWTLVREKSNNEEHEVTAASTFWGAMTTIVWADAVMGLDNALGIAGAAGGNWWLIIFGLLVSVPIILFGSTVIAKIIERWPKTIWIGALVLVIVALQMIWSEPVLQQYLFT
jgi:YjbE family integral membrane protein